MEDTTVKASVAVDIGENLTKLLEQLAKQVGTTADKVFPWYVQQQVLEGWASLCVHTAFLFVGLLMLVLSFRKSDFDNGNRYVFVLCAGGVMLFITTLSIALNAVDIVTQINNPHYGAMKAMTGDLARLLK